MALDRIMMQDGTTKQLAALDKLDAVKDTWIDWGTGAGQVSAVDLPIADAGSLYTATDVEAALQEVGGLNFNTRKYFSNGNPNVVNGATTAAISNVNQVPTEVIANQATANTGVLLGASHYSLAGPLPTPAGGAAATVEDRRILGIVVDVNGDPILMAGGQQVFFLYESLRNPGQTLYAAPGDAQWAFVYNDAGTWKYAAFPGTTGTYYSWPVIRYDFMYLPEDAMLYGGGGAEDLDNTPYSAGSGIAISAGYAISLSSLTGNWDAGNFEIRSNTFQSDVATGTAPFIIASTTKVTNLNVDSVDDQHFIIAAAEKGDVLYHDGSTWVNLHHGTAGEYLQTGGHGANPTWASVSGTLPAGTVDHETLVWNAGGSAWVGTGANYTIDHATGNMYTAGTADFTGNVDASAGVDVDADNQKITVGASADWEIVHNGADTVVTSKTGDLITDNTLVTGSTIFRLGTDTAATDFQVQNDSAAALLTITGAGQATFSGNVDATNGLDVSVAAFTFTGTTFDLDPTDNFTLDMDATKTATITIADNLDSSFLIQEGANGYLEIDTRNGTEIMNFGNTVTNPDYMFLGSGPFSQGAGGGQVTFTGNVDATNGLDVSVAALTMTGTNIDLDPTGTFALDMDANQTVTFTVADNLANTFRIQEGANMIMAVDSVNGSEKIDFGYNVNATAGLDVTGADLNVGAAAFAVGTDGVVDAGTWQATSIKSNYGGTGQTAYAAGDMLYWAAGTALSKLAIGTAYQILRTNSAATAPEWTSEGSMVTASVVTQLGVTTKRLVTAMNDAGTGKLNMADASGQSAISVVGVALSTVGAGAAVKLQTHGVVTCQIKSGSTSVTAGDIAYLAQAAGGYVAMYTDIAYTSGRTILPVGVFLETKTGPFGVDTDVLVALGGVGMAPVLVP